MIAFKLFSQAPKEDIPPGVPMDYPWVMRQCKESETVELKKEGWIITTEENYNSHVNDLSEKYGEWQPIREQLQLSPVTPRQIRLALWNQGITAEMIDESLNSLPEPEKSLALIEWEYSTIFERTHPLVNNVGLLLGWNEDQLNELWAYASTL